MRSLVLAFLFTTAFGWEHADWFKQVEGRIDADSIAWLRKQINPEESRVSLPLNLQDPCKSCVKGDIFEIEEPHILIFMSFSVPENIWLTFSKEMADCQAVFVIRGLPDNSFKSLAQKIALLKDRGMQTPIQIHPQLFKEYAVERVPSFVLTDQNEVSKAAGTVSLKYVADLFNFKEKARMPKDEAHL